MLPKIFGASQASDIIKTSSALARLEKIILDSIDFTQVVQKVCDSIFHELHSLNLGYRISVLALIDEKNTVLRRVSISLTAEAEAAIAAFPFPYDYTIIPLSAKQNYCIRAMDEKKSFVTHNWCDILTPPLTEKQAITSQKASGIKTSRVYPLIVRDKPIGIMIFSTVNYADEILSEEDELLLRFTDIAGLAVQNSQLYSSVEKTTEELKNANERLQALDKLKDEFVSLASHELRTPMTSIRSYVWMLLSNSSVGPLNEKQRLYLDRAYQSTVRLLDLVNDMLSVSRIESGRMNVNMKSLNIIQLIKDAFAEVSATAQEKKINLIFDEPKETLPNVLADQDKIKEVLINLIGNSLKFTPAEGKITLSVEQKDGMVITHVADTGKGIKQEDMPKLFQKFGMIEGNYTNLPSGQGTGLGLYICKGLVELHGGKINVSSEGENKGTTLSFSLKAA